MRQFGTILSISKTMDLEWRSKRIVIFLLGVAMMTKLKREWKEFRLLLQSVPPITVTIFALSVIVMNLLANKSVDMPDPFAEFLAMDCGLLISWGAFLTMDVLTKRYGPKAATELSIFALLINLACALLFYLGSRIPGSWGAAYEPNIDGTAANRALDYTFRGSRYVVLGSALAFTVSAFTNNFINFAIGKLFKKKPDGVMAYCARTYISTAIGQFVDNLVFALTVSYVFFGWSIVRCFVCAALGMGIELLCETLFSPIGYVLCKKWQRDGVGAAYLAFVAESKAKAKDSPAATQKTEKIAQ